MNAKPILLSGTSHPTLTQEIANILDLGVGKMDVHFFPDHEIGVRVLESVQQQHVFVVQSLFKDPNRYLMELLLIVDALKRAEAASITAIIPYYAYARQDRVDHPGAPIGAKLVANLLTTSGVDKVLTMDLHSEQIEGFFDIPIEQLLSQELFIPYCQTLQLENLIVVAPDKGGIKIASAYAKHLNVPMALIDKERMSPVQVEMRLFVGEVQNKTVLIVDDMCSTGSTLINAVYACAKLGAKRIFAIIGHGLFTKNALDQIQDSPVELLLTTNSVPLESTFHSIKKIHSLTIAPLFAKAVQTQFNSF